MENGIAFFVLGNPRPQGSKRHVGNGVLIEQSKYVKEWRNNIAWKAKENTKKQFTGPIQLSMVFVLKKPQKPKHSQPISRPDLDKLTRAVMDSLTRICYEDDSQVTKIVATKKYVEKNDSPGVFIKIKEII